MKMADARERDEKLLEAFHKDRQVVLDPGNPGYLVVLDSDLSPEEAAVTLNALTRVAGVIAVTAVAHNLRTIPVDDVIRQQMRDRLQAMLRELR